MELQYQTQAATGAKKILETYNGVFLSDVVGLGKTFIAALLLQQLQGKILVVCPPVLQNYWEESLRDFGIRSFEVQSLGKLEHTLRKDTSKYKCVLWTKRIASVMKIHRRMLGKNREIVKRKVVLFTESKETGDYLFENLFNAFQKKVMFYSSHGGRYEDLKTKHNHTVSRDAVTNNFDPKADSLADDIQILITTDVLAEGVNFFPTTHSDMHLGLEANITNKLQMFHYIMGEDAKYLSDGEKTGSQELFQTLNSKATYTGEDDGENTELKYLSMIREIRDSNPDLFDKIKKLPKQARSGMKSKNGNILPQPVMTVEKFDFNEGDLLVVEVQPSELPPVRYKGRVWVRIGPRKSLATEAEEKILTERRLSNIRTFDAMP